MPLFANKCHFFATNANFFQQMPLFTNKSQFWQKMPLFGNKWHAFATNANVFFLNFTFFQKTQEFANFLKNMFFFKTNLLFSKKTFYQNIKVYEVHFFSKNSAFFFKKGSTFPNMSFLQKMLIFLKISLFQKLSFLIKLFFFQKCNFFLQKFIL